MDHAEDEGAVVGTLVEGAGAGEEAGGGAAGAAGGAGEVGEEEGALVAPAGAQQLHRVLDPEGYNLARERARRTIERLAEGARKTCLKRVADRAKHVPVEDAGDVQALAAAYAKIEHGQSLARGTGPGGGVVVPIQFNVNIDEVP